LTPPRDFSADIAYALFFAAILRCHYAATADADFAADYRHADISSLMPIRCPPLFFDIERHAFAAMPMPIAATIRHATPIRHYVTPAIAMILLAATMPLSAISPCQASRF
jgi:hypothetical protein